MMDFIEVIHSPNAPKAIGPYSPCIKLGDFIYLSGQIPLNPISNKVEFEDIESQTKQVINNIRALLLEINLDLRHVVKTTIFMTDLSMFDKVNAIYQEYFTHPYPARSCVEVKALPKGSLIEIECMAIDTTRYENVNMNDLQGGCGGCKGCK